jgi:hypothetical protein
MLLGEFSEVLQVIMIIITVILPITITVILLITITVILPITITVTMCPDTVHVYLGSLSSALTAAPVPHLVVNVEHRTFLPPIHGNATGEAKFKQHH